MMKKERVFLIFTVMFLSALLACGADLGSDKGKYSYAIGYNIGSSMKANEVDLDMNSFNAAVKDALNGKESRLSQEQTQEAMQGLMAEMQKKRMESAGVNKKSGDDYLAANKIKEGVKTTSSGLQYKVVREGDGPRPKKTDTVTVHYSGKLTDGKEFDSSYKRNQPAKFRLDAVIPGWTEGVQLMRVGSKYEFVIPPELAYGAMGNQNIPGNSVLLFEVELLGVGK